MKNTVNFGFIAIIFIMTLLAFVWLGQIKNSNEKVLDLIEQFDQKIEYAHTMYNTIRTRQNLLLSMLVIDDPFIIDDKIQKFHAIALQYSQARSALQKLPMTKDEKNIHHLLDQQASLSQPVNDRAAEMFQVGENRMDISKVINEANKYQTELLKTLRYFVELQKKQDHDAVKFSRQQFDNSIYWISFFGLIAFLIALLVSRYVEKSVSDNSMELQKAYMKAEEATLIKSEFLATMSHEIRTPLTAIIGFAETTLFAEQTEAQRQNSVQTIIRCGKHLLSIINDILDLSKVEANKLEIENEGFSLFELLAEVEYLVRPTAEEKGLGFSINYIYPLPESIKNDSLRLKQILINLCNNAIKFTETGYVLINISCKCDIGENVLLFDVVDSGIGIAAEQQDLIFHAYRQADSSTTRKFGGTGLGLSLSKLLAEKMNGKLTISSEVGKGSKFSLSINFKREKNTKIAFKKENIPTILQKTSEAIAVQNFSGNVLLAEDNVDNQQLFRIYLERMGAMVTIVDNGQLAIAAVQEKEFDLIFMDVRMPVMGGLEAVTLLREKGFTKPIVALTANAMQEDKDACFDVGCDDFLTKPLDVARFSEVIEKYLNLNETPTAKTDCLISTLLEEDPGAIELIKRFVNNFSTSLEKINNLIDDEDWKSLLEKLHQIKGTGGNFGFEDVFLQAEDMESYAKDKNIDKLKKVFFELKLTHKKMLEGLK